MRKIIAAVFQSLDGIMQAPGGPTEDPTGGFALGGWTVPLTDETTGAAMGPIFSTPYDLLLGRKTYDIFAGHWPYVPADDPVGAAFGKAAKYVLTHSNDALDWQNSHRVHDIEAVKALKAGAGPDLFIWGSSTLFPQLFAENLLDRLILITFPVVLGHGKRLFGQGTPAFGMKLVSHEVSATGVIFATYEPAGKVATSSFPSPPPSAAELNRRERMALEG